MTTLTVIHHQRFGRLDLDMDVFFPATVDKMNKLWKWFKVGDEGPLYYADICLDYLIKRHALADDPKVKAGLKRNMEFFERKYNK